MKLKIAHGLTILLFALVMGVFWGTWFALARSMAEITPATFLEVGKTIAGLHESKPVHESSTALDRNPS